MKVQEFYLGTHPLPCHDHNLQTEKDFPSKMRIALQYDWVLKVTFVYFKELGVNGDHLLSVVADEYCSIFLLSKFGAELKSNREFFEELN